MMAGRKEGRELPKQKRESRDLRTEPALEAKKFGSSAQRCTRLLPDEHLAGRTILEEVAKTFSELLEANSTPRQNRPRVRRAELHIESARRPMTRAATGLERNHRRIHRRRVVAAQNHRRC